MIVHQIRSDDGTGTLSYLLAMENDEGCVVIDPNINDVELIRSSATKLGKQIRAVVDTHTHADHVSGAGVLREQAGAQVIMHENTRHKWKIIDEGDKFGIGDILRENAKIPIDTYVQEDGALTFESLNVRTMFTPGHTDNHVSLIAGDCLFTGDLLLIGQAGRSDLPGGNPSEQYDSLFRKIVPLPDHFKMYPGHDYENNVYSLLGEEKKTNPFLKKRTRAEYIEFVTEFFPPLSELGAGGRMTLQCGVQRVTSDEVKQVSPEEAEVLIKSGRDIVLLDVREPIELLSVGAIKGVLNIPLGSLKTSSSMLPEDKSAEIVCICASGSRSSEAAHYLRTRGYSNVVNLSGGTMAWLKSGRPVSKPATA